MRPCIAVVWAVFIFLFPVPSSATIDETEQLCDPAARVTLSARQSALLNSVVMSVCFLIGDLNAKQLANQTLEQANTYGTVLAGLREGQQWLELLPETTPTHLDPITRNDRRWERFEPAIP